MLVKLLKTFDLLFGFVLRDAVGLLDLARQLIAIAGNHVEVIVGECAPIRFHFALELLPVAFNDIPVHINVLLSGSDWRYCQSRILRRSHLFVTWKPGVAKSRDNPMETPDASTSVVA